MEAQKMKEVIRNILNNYLDHTIVQKIEIKNILTRDILDESSGNLYKVYDIHELLRLSFDIMEGLFLQLHAKNFQEILKIYV